MSASIPSISVYPDVGVVKYVFFQSTSATCSARFWGGNIDLTGNANCQATTDSSGIERIIKCSAQFSTDTDLAGGTFNFVVVCGNATIFESSFDCSNAIIPAGPFVVEVTQSTS